MQLIDLSKPKEYQIRQCELFTEYCLNRNRTKYSNRGSYSIDKIERDIFLGKIAECMAWNELYLAGLNPSPVDFSLHGWAETAFHPDLFVGDIAVHIKSCMGDNEYPNSWVFQSTDPVVIDPWGQELFLCVLNEDMSGYAYFCSATEVSFKDSVLERFVGVKKCVYESDLLIALNS